MRMKRLSFNWTQGSPEKGISGTIKVDVFRKIGEFPTKSQEIDCNVSDQAAGFTAHGEENIPLSQQQMNVLTQIMEAYLAGLNGKTEYTVWFTPGGSHLPGRK